jgi:hypothetical protein
VLWSYGIETVESCCGHGGGGGGVRGYIAVRSETDAELMRELGFRSDPYAADPGKTFLYIPNWRPF